MSMNCACEMVMCLVQCLKALYEVEILSARFVLLVDHMKVKELLRGHCGSVSLLTCLVAMACMASSCYMFIRWWHANLYESEICQKGLHDASK